VVTVAALLFFVDTAIAVVTVGAVVSATAVVTAAAFETAEAVVTAADLKL
jgi:L-asparaginase/Glu-tRNA(Gln) amidotransferase subunit D